MKGTLKSKILSHKNDTRNFPQSEMYLGSVGFTNSINFRFCRMHRIKTKAVTLKILESVR